MSAAAAAATLDLDDLDLFADSSRWPKKPYCAEDLAMGVRIRTLKLALTKPYIQANPPHLRVWSIFDIDRPGAVLAWEAVGLPPPSWAAGNPENAHAHLAWGLSAPVLVDSPDLRQGPLRYLCALEAAMRARLNADQGYSGLLTKNPASSHWRVWRGPKLYYELGELAEYVPDIEKHIPSRGRVEEVGLGRNITVFDWLRRQAYRRLRDFRTPGAGLDGWNAWCNWCNCRALERNGEFPSPLEGREVWHIAKSVAKWTWRRFDIAGSDTRFSQLQAHRGRAGGVAKGKANEGKRASARLMAAQGIGARRISVQLGVHRDTIYSWLSE